MRKNKRTKNEQKVAAVDYDDCAKTTTDFLFSLSAEVVFWQSYKITNHKIQTTHILVKVLLFQYLAEQEKMSKQWAKLRINVSENFRSSDYQQSVL